MVSSQAGNSCSGEHWLECAALKSCIAAGLLCMPCICYQSLTLWKRPKSPGMLVAGAGLGLTALLVFTGMRSSSSKGSCVIGSLPVSCSEFSALSVRRPDIQVIRAQDVMSDITSQLKVRGGCVKWR